MRRMTHDGNSGACNSRRRGVVQQLAALGILSLTGMPAVAAAGKKQPQRVVSVGSAVTEIIYALNAQDTIVATDTTSIYPEATQQLPKVGYYRSLAAEGIMAMSPTQVIATQEAGPPTAIRQLSNAGIPVNIVNAKHQFEGIVDCVKRLGTLLGREEAAQQLAANMQAEWKTVRQRIDSKTSRKPRILFILSHSPSQIMVAGRNNAADAIISYAGGINAITGFEGYKPLTPEAVIAAQPDVVLFSDQGLTAIGGIEQALKLPGLSQTEAGRKKRIVSQDAILMLGFGPRLPAAVASLHDAIMKAPA